MPGTKISGEVCLPAMKIACEDILGKSIRLSGGTSQTGRLVPDPPGKVILDYVSAMGQKQYDNSFVLRLASHPFSCIQFTMSTAQELNEASSSESKGVDPSEHPNIWDGGGNADEADKDKDKEDAEPINEENAVKPPNPAASSNEVSSSKLKGKAVDPSEHSNSTDGGGNVDEDDRDEDEEDAELVDEEMMHNAVKPVNPATSSKAKKVFGMHKAQPTPRKGTISSLHSQLISDGIC